MVVPCVNYTTIPKPLLLLALFLHRITSAFSSALLYLGLYPYSEDHADHAYWLSSADVQSSTSPITPSSIKSQLPVVEFTSLHRGSPRLCHDEELVCVVCLGDFEEKDEIRELGNCCHIFHKGCIDKWVDMGHLTCPLCRSQLIPCKRKGKELRGLLRGFLARIG